MKVVIYSLVDKATGLRFYIGKTECSLWKRKAEHRSLAMRRVDNPLYKYIRVNKIDFDIQAIDSIECSSSSSPDACILEQNWIDFLRGEGYMLLNKHRSSFV